MQFPIHNSWAVTATSRDCFIPKPVNKDKTNAELAQTQSLFKRRYFQYRKPCERLVPLGRLMLFHC